MRILAVTPYYEPEGGGLERYAHEILKRLAASGNVVSALTLTSGPAAREERDGVLLERVPAQTHLGNAPISAGFRGAVGRTIEATRPDVVVAHTPVPIAAELAFLAARRRRVPFVLTYHAGRLRGSSRLLNALAQLHRTTLEGRMLAASDRLVAVSPYVRDHALGRQKDRVDVVMPGVDLDAFAPGGPPLEREILFVGPLDRSYRWKGLDVAWRAFERVRHEVPGARLRLIGRGDRLQEFSRAAAGFDGALEVVERVTTEELVAAYHRCSVLVLPSTTDAESFGMVLAEANACARPVVASNIGGIPDFVRDGENGFLIRPGDDGQLAERVVRLLRDPALAERMGRQGRARVVAHHDWEKQARRTQRILEEAASHVRRPRPQDEPLPTEASPRAAAQEG